MRAVHNAHRCSDGTIFIFPSFFILRERSYFEIKDFRCTGAALALQHAHRYTITATKIICNHNNSKLFFFVFLIDLFALATKVIRVNCVHIFFVYNFFLTYQVCSIQNVIIKCIELIPMGFLIEFITIIFWLWIIIIINTNDVRTLEIRLEYTFIVFKFMFSTREKAGTIL